MWNKIKNIINKIKEEYGYRRCYSIRKDQGIAVSGMCDGVVGGTINTEYLSEECINCPYYVRFEE